MQHPLKPSADQLVLYFGWMGIKCCSPVSKVQRLPYIPNRSQVSGYFSTETSWNSELFQHSGKTRVKVVDLNNLAGIQKGLFFFLLLEQSRFIIQQHFPFAARTDKSGYPAAAQTTLSLTQCICCFPQTFLQLNVMMPMTSVCVAHHAGHN